MRIAVIGVGGVGGHLGGRLAHGGAEVIFIARGATLDAIRAGGLRVDSRKGALTIRPALVTDDPSKAGPVDWVLIATKAGQVEEAARAAQPMLAPHAGVLTLQNGVEAHDIAARVVGARHVAIGVCQFSSFILGPGHIQHAASLDPELVLGEPDNRPSERIERLRDAFVAGGVNAVAAKDILAALWLKFAAITARAGLGSVTRSPIGVWRAVAETRALADQAAEEPLAVARAHGVALPADAARQIMAGTDAFGPDVLMSMQRDIAAGKPSELEFLTGAVVRLGREAGVPTPVHSFIRAVLMPQEMRAHGKVAWSG